MKKSLVVAGFMMAILGTTQANAQINLGDRALGAVQKGLTSFTISDGDAANLSKQAVDKMDVEGKVAGPNDPYTVRLNRVFGKHKNEAGLALNYKVYLVKDVNAFATADGSVRVFSGLMDIMDDNEFGHVANHDSRDAMKAAYQKEALIDAAASQSGKIAAVTDGQLGKLASAIIDCKHSRKQESEADEYSYGFLKRNKYNVNAEESAFNILAKMSEGQSSSFIDKMMSSHPDSKERAAKAKERAEKDGLYKPYVKQTAKTTTKKGTKKPTKKKK
jgi:metalloprotease